MVLKYFSSEARAERAARAEAQQNDARRAELQRRRNWLALEHEALSDHESIADEFELAIVAKRGEEGLLVIDGVQLIETRAGGARYRGSSMGVSIRVAKGVYLRPGVHGGQIERQPDEMKVIDSGTFTITTKRCVFAGPLQTRTWEYSKMVSIDYSSRYEGRPALLIPVENRQKTSGVVIDANSMRYVQSRLGFATALFSGSEERYLSDWATDVSELDAEIAAIPSS